MKHRTRVPSMGSIASLASRAAERSQPTQIVMTQNGPIQGKQIKLKDGTVYDTFQGVPYAKPPIGELRFKKPVRPANWEHVLQCCRYKDRSVQSDMFWDKIMQTTSQSEDCLYLNIYAPEYEPGKCYPVMYYIHGGGFMMDSPARLVPRKLCRQIASKEVVLVTVTYRLGYLGFFCTGDEACTGNMGMFDQAMGLQWVRDNIKSFGGDPNDITACGQSAGGVSVDLLSISPLTRGKFHKKIVLGGNSFCPWAVTTKEEISDYCTRKAQKLGWKADGEYASKKEENEAMMDFLRTIPAHKFATTMHGNRLIFSEARLPLCPVYDKEFLPRTIDALRNESPKMPSICGVGEYESLLFVAIGFLRCNGKDVDNCLNVLSKKSKKLNYKEVCEAAQKLYGDSPATRGNRAACARLFATMSSDVISNYPCYKYLEYSQTHHERTYAYSFDYTSKRMFGWLGPMLPFVAGTHSSEIIYLMDVNYLSSPCQKNKRDMDMCRITSDYFTNFIKTGNPNTETTAPMSRWQPVPKDGKIDIFSLSLSPQMKQDPFSNRMEKLEEIVDNIIYKRSCKKDDHQDDDHDLEELDINNLANHLPDPVYINQIPVRIDEFSV